MLRTLFTHPLRHPSHLGLLTVLASLLVSYGLWLGSMAYYSDWYDNPWKYPAKVGSHSATLLMCWAFILSTRFRVVERLFGGLDKVYQAHRLIGIAAFILIFLHPVFLAAPRLADGPAAYFGYFFSSSVAVNTGLVALAGFILLVVLSLTSKLAYHRWKQTHDFFGLLLVLIIAHGILAHGEIMRYPALRLWFALWCTLGLSAYLYIRLLYRWIGPQYDYLVSSVTPVGNDITDLSFQPVKRALTHQPGQFLYVSFDADAVSREPHPFTISSPPESPTLRLSIKSLGDWTSRVEDLKPGAPARLWGPYGHFSDPLWAHPRTPAVFLAGGIGITPFLSLLASTRFQKRSAPTWVFYSVQSPDKAVYHNELQALVTSLPLTTFVEHISDQEGFINLPYLTRHLTSLTEKHYFLCGPAPMTRSLRQNLLHVGVPLEHLHAEEFQIR